MNNVDVPARKSYYLSKEAYDLLKKYKKRTGDSMAESARYAIINMYRKRPAVAHLGYLCVNEHYFCFSASDVGEFDMLDDLHAYYNKAAPKRFSQRSVRGIYSRNLILDYAIRSYFKK